MSKAMRFTMMLVGLAVIAGIGFVAIPRDCDYSLRGKLEPTVWANNMWSRLTGQSQDCDPWGHTNAVKSTSAVAIISQVNAIDGPAASLFYIRPDGRGFVQKLDFLAEYPLSTESILSNLDNKTIKASYETFPFNDPELFQSVSHLISPLRPWSGRPRDLYDDVYPGRQKKSVIPCEAKDYHGHYEIFWDADYLNYKDVSYFEGGLASPKCPAQVSALNRLYSATDLMRQKYPH